MKVLELSDLRWCFCWSVLVWYCFWGSEVTWSLKWTCLWLIVSVSLIWTPFNPLENHLGIQEWSILVPYIFLIPLLVAIFHSDDSILAQFFQAQVVVDHELFLSDIFFVQSVCILNHQKYDQSGKLWCWYLYDYVCIHNVVVQQFNWTWQIMVNWCCM